MATKKEYTAAEINMMAKSARPISFDPLNDKEMATKYADRKRTGKTAKDHRKKPREEVTV